MSSILFYDSACPAPYSSESLTSGNSGIGGAEATVARVAAQLSARHTVYVGQHNRTKREHSEGRALHWISKADLRDPSIRPDAVVVLRRVGELPMLHRRFPRAGLFVWSHDWFAPKNGSLVARIVWAAKTELRVLLHAYYRAAAIGVSQTHEQNIRESFDGTVALRWLSRRIKISYVYNPIADDLHPSPAGETYDPDKLVYFSAAWKGLDLVLAAFSKVRESLPNLKLYLASPGYQLPDGKSAGDNVIALGNLSHAEVMDHVRTSLTVFYPADRIPETFGLVFAESNAVGTPVLTHPFGAAPELLTSEQLVHAHDTPELVNRLRSWSSGGRPHVAAKDQFRLSAVCRAWEDLLFKV